MKAIINGISVEGTPAEVAEFQRIINSKEQHVNSHPVFKTLPFIANTVGGCIDTSQFR